MMNRMTLLMISTLMISQFLFSLWMCVVLCACVCVSGVMGCCTFGSCESRSQIFFSSFERFFFLSLDLSRRLCLNLLKCDYLFIDFDFDDCQVSFESIQHGRCTQIEVNKKINERDDFSPAKHAREENKTYTQRQYWH
jgi:hypothetical protein